MAKSVAKDLIAHGKISRGYIGVNIGEVDNAMAKALGLSKPEGVIVQGLVEGGAASKADIKAGDVILKIDGKEVNEPNTLQSYIAGKSAGTTVTLTLYRDGKEITREVTLKARETEQNNEPVVNKDNNENENNDSNSTTAFDDLGLTVRNLNAQEKSQYSVDHGVMITEVKPYSKAEDQRLFQGLVILEANKKKVDSVSDFKSTIDENKGKSVMLRVADSQGNKRFIALEIPE